MIENSLKNIWASGSTAINGWLTIPSTWTAELLAHAEFDSLTIDMQHGFVDYKTAINMLRAISGNKVTPLVRVPWNEPAPIMRMLDAGAMGIVAPVINNKDDAHNLVDYCKYPPLGIRSYGPMRPELVYDEDYFENANENIIALAQIETSEALNNLEEILATEGLDGIYVGTMDLSISLGIEDKGNLNNTSLRDAIELILENVKKHDLIAGIHAREPDQVDTLINWGFRLITPVNDSKLLRRYTNEIVTRSRKNIR